MDDDPKETSKGFASSSQVSLASSNRDRASAAASRGATTASPSSSARTHHPPAEAGRPSHAPEEGSVEATSTGTMENRHTTGKGRGGGKGGTRAGRSRVSPSSTTSTSLSSTRIKANGVGVGSGSVMSATEDADSTERSASTSAVTPTQRIEPTPDEVWLSLDLDEDVPTVSQVRSLDEREVEYPWTEIPPAAAPDSPRSPESAGRLTIQEVHGLPGAFMSTATGHYVHREEAEALRHLTGEGDDSVADEVGRSSFVTQAPSSRAPNEPPSPSSTSQRVEPSGSQPAEVQTRLNEILVEARPVARSRSFNSEDEDYSYGSDDLLSDQPTAGGALPSASVQRRRSTRRGDRASARSTSLRQQLGEMDGSGRDPPPLLVDAQPIPKRSRTQTWLLLGLGSLAVVAALAVGLSLGLTRPNSSGEANDVAPTMAPSASPTSTLAGEFRSSLPALTQAALENGTSPQSLAFQYVVTHSGATASANEADTLDRLGRMTQQFALLTLFFSTSGEAWTRPWINTTSNDAADGPTVDECNWADQGVTCDANQTVVRLSLESFSLKGTVPREIALLAQLADLNLASNSQLYGTLPPEIGSLTRLTSLALSGNLLSGHLPTELGNLTRLGNLNIDANEFNGPLPSEVGRLTGLTSLKVGRNGLTGAIPTDIGHLTLLSGIELMSNYFESSLPTELGLLTLATTFRVVNNSLTGQLPTEIGRLTKLTMIHAYSNSLSGTLPTELGNLVELTYVAVDTNYMVGTIPTELGLLTNVNTFWAFDNELQGPLPPELGNMVKLQDFNLTRNSLTGTLPPQLGNLTALKKLDVSFSALSGSIPSDLARLNRLELLYLTNNRLTGTVPDGLGGLSQLRELALTGNSLNGTIASGGDVCLGVASNGLQVRVDCSELVCECDCRCDPVGVV